MPGVDSILAILEAYDAEGLRFESRHARSISFDLEREKHIIGCMDCMDWVH